MIDFSLPIYNKDGKKQIDILGKEIDISDDKIYYVHDAMIKTFKDNISIGNIEIKTQIAEIMIDEKIVKGEKEISVTGNGFSFIGNNWELISESKNIKVNNGVEIIFPANSFNVNINQHNNPSCRTNTNNKQCDKSINEK